MVFEGFEFFWFIISYCLKCVGRWALAIFLVVCLGLILQVRLWVILLDMSADAFCIRKAISIVFFLYWLPLYICHAVFGIRVGSEQLMAAVLLPDIWAVSPLLETSQPSGPEVSCPLTKSDDFQKRSPELVLDQTTYSLKREVVDSIHFLLLLVFLLELILRIWGWVFFIYFLHNIYASFFLKYIYIFLFEFNQSLIKWNLDIWNS